MFIYQGKTDTKKQVNLKAGGSASPIGKYLGPVCKYLSAPSGLPSWKTLLYFSRNRQLLSAYCSRQAIRETVGKSLLAQEPEGCWVIDWLSLESLGRWRGRVLLVPRLIVE